MENVLTQHITKTPGVCGGRACIAGHPFRITDIVVWHEIGGRVPITSWICFRESRWLTCMQRSLTTSTTKRKLRTR